MDGSTEIGIAKGASAPQKSENSYAPVAVSQVNADLEKGSAGKPGKLRESSKGVIGSTYSYLERQFNGHHIWIAAIQTTPDGKYAVSGSLTIS